MSVALDLLCPSYTEPWLAAEGMCGDTLSCNQTDGGCVVTHSAVTRLMVREFHEHRACMKFLEMSEKISNLVAFSVSSCGNGEVLWFVAKRPG